MQLNLIATPRVPKFGRYVDYFSTNVGSTSASGKGIADYSNRRFFTQVKNLGSNDFQFPPNDPLQYSTTCKDRNGADIVPRSWDGSPLEAGIELELLCGAVSESSINA